MVSGHVLLQMSLHKFTLRISSFSALLISELQIRHYGSLCEGQRFQQVLIGLLQLEKNTAQASVPTSLQQHSSVLPHSVLLPHFKELFLNSHLFVILIFLLKISVFCQEVVCLAVDGNKMFGINKTLGFKMPFILWYFIQRLFSFHCSTFHFYNMNNVIEIASLVYA